LNQLDTGAVSQLVCLQWVHISWYIYSYPQQDGMAEMLKTCTWEAFGLVWPQMFFFFSNLFHMPYFSVILTVFSLDIDTLIKYTTKNISDYPILYFHFKHLFAL
jgi:hypothetical protein